MLLSKLAGYIVGKFDKIQDHEFWQEYKGLQLPRTLAMQIRDQEKPCPTCGEPHSNFSGRESKIIYGELVCGYCFDDYKAGRKPERKQWKR